ncbi:MAG: hypothetical protein ACP5E5_11765 [Acidobacteriaceae bacterium]
MPKSYRVLTAVFALWLLVWIYLSWPMMQDDAFIHLRYAVNLLQHHMISYGGVHPDYGTSSLLYVWLLAAVRCFSKSPVMPRALSSLFHLLLFAGLAWEFPKALGKAPRLAWSFALLLLGTLVTPMAVRWLDDGMETSLTLGLVALLAVSVSRLGHEEVLRKRSMVWLAILGFLATLARVEYLLLLGVVSLTLFFERYELRGADVGPNPDLSPEWHPAGESEAEEVSEYPRIRAEQAAVCGLPLAGSLLAAGLIYLTMRALLPDTAVAKANAQIPWADKLGVALGVLKAGASVFVSSMSVGIVLLIFWLLTLVAVVVYRRRFSLSILTANSLFPVVLTLAMERGQQIQGVRYFLWTLVFPVLWNTLELRWYPAEPSASIARALRVATYGIAGFLLVLMPVESILLSREFRTREQSLAEFRAQHLERLYSLNLVAFDVGYIGYFTGSSVCDMAGLVNGRARSLMPFEQRVALCAAEHPEYAFVSGFSLSELRHAMSLKGWSVCGVYDFANLRASDPHYLIASPQATAAVCEAAGNAPRPIETMLGP